MGLILRVAIAAAVAIIFYAVATTLVTFPYSGLFLGLIALAIFIALGFGDRVGTWGRRGPPPAV